MLKAGADLKTKSEGVSPPLQSEQPLVTIQWRITSKEEPIQGILILGLLLAEFYISWQYTSEKPDSDLIWDVMLW